MSGVVVLVDLIPDPAWLRVSIRDAGERDGTHWVGIAEWGTGVVLDDGGGRETRGSGGGGEQASDVGTVGRLIPGLGCRTTEVGIS